MEKIFNIILILIVFVACQNQLKQDNEVLPVFELTEPSTSNILKLSDMSIKDVDYIPLETNDSSLFNNIRKLIVSGSDIYIVDYQGTILRFGNDGSYKNRIGRKGRGPKEYSNVIDFTIDPDSQDLYILASGVKKIYSYTNRGSFLNSFSVPEGTSAIMFNDGNILCHRPYATGEIGSYLVMVDKIGNVKEQFANYKYKIKLNSQFTYLREIIWFRFESNLYIKDIHSDTVFLFKNRQFIPQFVLDHGGKTISVEARSQFDTEEKFSLTLGPKYSVELNVWRFGVYVISDFMYDKKLFIYASDFNKNTEHLANLRPGIINDIDGGARLWFNTIYYYNDHTILSWADASELIIHVQSEEFKNSIPKYPEKKKELEKLANSLDENDNPVLMLVKLKE